MEQPRLHAVDYFHVLARARHLMRDAQAILDQRALVNLDLLGDAARKCGATPEWEPFDAHDFSHLERLFGALAGSAYAVGYSTRSPGVRVIHVHPSRLESAQHEIDFCSDVALIGVAVPVVGMVHHDALCAVMKLAPALGSPEEPRELERYLRRQMEQRRKEALARIPLPIRQGMLAILEDKKRIAAVKYLRAELDCSLVSAKRIVDLVAPWWPDEAVNAASAHDPS